MSDLVDSGKQSTALAPIEDGWKLRAVTGHSVWKLVPPRARPLARVLSVLPTTLFVGAVLGVVVWTGGNFYVWWLVGKGGLAKFGFLAAAAAGMARMSARLVLWQMRRLAALHVSIASLRGSPPGSLVRITGTVRAEAPFTAAVSGLPTVLAQYEVRPSSGAPTHQVRGVDFFLDVDGSETVRIAVKDAYFDARQFTEASHPANLAVMGYFGSAEARFREARLAPGDHIEAVGILVREVDPALTGGPGRTPGLRLCLQASPRMPLLLRKLRGF